MTTLHAILEKKACSVVDYLEKYFDELAVDALYPVELLSACRYVLFGGGKRLRPALVFLVNEMFGGKDEDIAPLAGAIELIHSYSLVHDDLPAMDDDDLRRGRATCHIKYGEAMAILCGDALLTESFRMLSCLDRDPARVVSIIGQLSAAAGLGGMVAGQVADCRAENRAISMEELQFIHKHKTGALIEASIVLPGIANGVNAEALESLAIYGKNIGLAFQIADDILDETADQEQLGKPIGSDRESGKSTYVSYLGLDGAAQRAQEVVATAKAALQAFDGDSSALTMIADYFINRKK